MNLLPDEPLWLLEDGDQRTAHGSVMEAMEWLQEAHPDFQGWTIDPVRDDGARVVRCTSEPNGWIVRRA